MFSMIFIADTTCDTPGGFIFILIVLIIEDIVTILVRVVFYFKIFYKFCDEYNKVANDEENQRIEGQDIENQRVQQHNEAFYAER